MEAVQSYLTSITYHTTWRHITEDRTFIFALNLLMLSTATRFFDLFNPEDGGSIVQ
jgi:hypothetical protein